MENIDTHARVQRVNSFLKQTDTKHIRDKKCKHGFVKDCKW